MRPAAAARQALTVAQVHPVVPAVPVLPGAASSVDPVVAAVEQRSSLVVPVAMAV
jgi:hypothetical protein